MSLEVEWIMETLRALAKNTTRRESQRFVAAEQAIKTWLAQTSDPTERQVKLWELEDEMSAAGGDDFWDGLLAHIEQQLNTLAVARDRP
jgi:hypothetical protein